MAIPTGESLYRVAASSARRSPRTLEGAVEVTSHTMEHIALRALLTDAHHTAFELNGELALTLLFRNRDDFPSCEHAFRSPALCSPTNGIVSTRALHLCTGAPWGTGRSYSGWRWRGPTLWYFPSMAWAGAAVPILATRTAAKHSLMCEPQKWRFVPGSAWAGEALLADYDHLTWANGDRLSQTAYTVRSTARRPELAHDHRCRDVPQPASLIIFDRLG